MFQPPVHPGLDIGRRDFIDALLAELQEQMLQTPASPFIRRGLDGVLDAADPQFRDVFKRWKILLWLCW